MKRYTTTTATTTTTTPTLVRLMSVADYNLTWVFVVFVVDVAYIITMGYGITRTL